MQDDIREPTDAERARFLRAATTLARLGRKGCWMYLAEDSLHLMSGPSHDGKQVPKQDRVRETVRIPRAGGGDW